MQEDDDLAFFMSPMALRKSASLKATNSSPLVARRSSIPMMHTPSVTMDNDDSIDNEDGVQVVPVPVVRRGEQQRQGPSAASSKEPLLPPQAPQAPQQQQQQQHLMPQTADQASPPTRSSGSRHHHGEARIAAAGGGPSPTMGFGPPTSVEQQEAHHQHPLDNGTAAQGPPEALYLTGGNLGPAAYNYYAPPLKWRGNNTNPRERRVETGSVHLGPAGTLGGWGASPSPYQRQQHHSMPQSSSPSSPPPHHHRQAAALAVVGNSPVVWSHEASDAMGRRDVVRQRQHDASLAGALDETILQIACNSPSVGDESGQHASSLSHRFDRPLFDDQLGGVGGGGESLLMEAFPNAMPIGAAPLGVASPSRADPGPGLLSTAAPTTSVRHYYASSSITPFRRVHVHREEEMKPPAASATDKTVDGRRVWGPKEERKHDGVYRSWWQ